MEASKKKKRRNILFFSFVVILVLILVAVPFLLDAQQNSEKSKASILSATVEVGDIRKTLSGTGTLEEQEAGEVSVPEGVKVTKYLVVNGQFVKKGDPVATVDRVSVMETISDIRGQMDSVAAEMETLRSASDYSSISAPANGKVKAVYASVGESVHDVILRDGALAVLSLDGSMALRFPAPAGLSIGQRVTVILSAGTEVSGRVETVIDGEATVLISDDYGRIGEQVRVVDAEGRNLGEGTLYVHSAWKAMATKGKISNVYITEGRTVSMYGTMFSLNGVSSGGSYEQLASEHRQYEEVIARLFQMYVDGILLAPCDGCVSGVDDNLLEQLAYDGSEKPVLKLLAGELGGNTTYYNYIGIVTSANSAMLQNKGSIEISDYTDLPYLNTDLNSFIKTYSFNFFPIAYQLMPNEDYYPYYGELYDGVYEKNEDGSYTQTEDTQRDPNKIYYVLTRWKPVEVVVGGIYLFLFTSSEPDPSCCVSMIYLNYSVELPNVNPGEKDKDKNPSGTGGNSNGGFSGSGSMPGGGSGGSQDQTVAPVVNETTILSVTPQETMTVSITLDELDILSVHEGQEATVKLDALPGQSFHGIITKVNTTASNEGGNSKYSATVQMARNGMMLGGMNASANITVDSREQVLLVPSAALTEQGTQLVVYTDCDTKSETLLQPVPVKTGLSDGEQVEILSGLKAGDKVWYSYFDKLEINGLPMS